MPTSLIGPAFAIFFFVAGPWVQGHFIARLIRKGRTDEVVWFGGRTNRDWILEQQAGATPGRALMFGMAGFAMFTVFFVRNWSALIPALGFGAAASFTSWWWGWNIKRGVRRAGGLPPPGPPPPPLERVRDA